MSNLPKITFGIIILNGEPFTIYNLKALYPFAHQIIVVEGASPLAAHAANPDGHSIDNTLEVLRYFKSEYDLENKITLVTAEDHGYPNGFWPKEKTEQSQAFAMRATGDWLWQIDIDEFYSHNDMLDICRFLQTRMPSVVFFYLRAFMYHPRLEVKGVEPEYSKTQPIVRIFRWGEGYQYITHRPPTVVDSQNRDLKFIDPVTAEITSQRGWYIWHYPFLFRKQFLIKAEYYEKHNFREGIGDWVYKATDMHQPRFSVLWSGLSWLEPINSKLPEGIEAISKEHIDYSIPSYLNQPYYRFLISITSAYLRLLRMLRVRFWGYQWFYSSYMVSYQDRVKMEARETSDKVRKVKSLFKTTPLFKLAKYLGLVGYRPF